MLSTFANHTHLWGSSVFLILARGGDFSVSEWPGGIGGGDYDKRDVPIPEAKIEPDGTYRCSVCNQGFSTRQDYDDHYITDHTKEDSQKNYPKPYT
jgi:hypothetical protein